jgi:hypothetical protein
MPKQKKELSMRMRFFVSGLVCLMMSSVLFAAAFPSGVRLTRLDHGHPSDTAIVRAADARPRS